jgi:hypothetical protein
MQRVAIPAGTRPLGSLAYQVTFDTFWSFLTGKYSKEWAEAIATVYERCDINASQWNIISFVSTYRMQDVEAVMNCYGNLASTGKIPEYIDPDHDGSQTANKRAIWKAVAKCAGQTEAFVRLVMYEFYYATQDRSIPNACFIQPMTCERSAASRQNPPPEGEGWASYASNIALFAAAGVMLYLIFTKR